MKRRSGAADAMRAFTSLGSITAIRRSLVSLIPILLLGAFALMIKSFPIEGYQKFVLESFDGAIASFLNIIFNATFGLLSAYICINIGYHYASLKEGHSQGELIGCPVVSLSVFVILTGIDSLGADTLGPKGMFIAIVASLGASAAFCRTVKLFKPKKLLADGADSHLNDALRFVFPVAITIAFFALLNSALTRIFDVENMHGLILRLFNYLFSLIKNEFLTGLLFVLVSSVLWFFGIHGSDILEGVANTMFIPKIDINIALVEAGKAPAEILTKQFFDVFVLMGGCGSAMCLLIALLLFGKRKSNKNLAKMAAFPMIFNINEIMIFGLPVIYNPTILIPFLAVPLVCFFTSYAAMASGLVPMVTSPLEWTIPVILGGYMATGSVMGSLLQIFNLVVGVLIYRPFVKRYDDERIENFKRDYENLVEYIKANEKRREDFVLTDLHGSDGAFAKSFAAEIAYAIENREFEVYYQPQYNIKEECVGAEALLRFSMPNIGFVYPPLVIALASESGKLELLERYIFERAVEDSERLYEMTGTRLKISVNISGESIQSRAFEEFLLSTAESFGRENPLCIEITEQTAIIFTDELKSRMKRLRDAGYLFAIDDFSAGNTSLQYLQENFFDIVKLDGSIVQNSVSNERCNEFTTRIIELSHNLGFSVIAEYVSSKVIRDCMARAGCTIYQGWFYSPAIKFDVLCEIIKVKSLGNEE